MTIRFVSVEEAMERSGLRMVVVSNIPSPWGEAAKGIFHLKGIDCLAVRLTYDNDTLKAWLGGQRSGPVAFYDKEPARSGWSEILLLAERLAPTPALLPVDPTHRALVFGLAHELCAEGGLGWSRRLQLVHVGLQNAGGFNERASKYLGRKYGYALERSASYGARVIELLGMFAARLKAQAAVGSRYYVGDSLTAIDIYSATFCAMFRPLPDTQCPMDPLTRAAFETIDAQTEAALDPVLFAHRDMMYAEHLALPLSL